MTDQPILSEAEWAVVIELLEREQAELPVEIHHCRVGGFRDDLRHRLTIVHGLLERLHAPAVA